MSDLTGPAGAERLANYVLGRFDVPPYARRARDVAEAFERLVARCRRKYEDLLGPVRAAFNRLRTATAGWDRLRPWLADDGQVGRFAELETRLGSGEMPAGGPASDRTVRRHLIAFRAAADAFNVAWQAFIDQLDLSGVNALREGYNRFYLLEKECALRSAKLARVGYVPLAPVDVSELRALFPFLPIPLLRQ